MIGKKLAHYRILEQLGKGGMGVVYKAKDEKLHRTVAIKILPPEILGNEILRLRFLQEARSAAAVTHPYIGVIHEANEEDGMLYIVMEFIEGENLRAHLARGALPIEEALRLGNEIAEGIACAHQNNVIHRDLKPENVMLSKDDHVKILDFGLAKVLEPEDDTETMQADHDATVVQQLTMHGEVMGTPAYMSPEQARGLHVDARSDLFSFGSMFCEMLKGHSPFQGPTRMDTLSAILHAEPLSKEKPSEQLPPEVERILRKCLQKDPKNRYQTADDLVVDLRNLQRDSTALSTSGIIAPKPRIARRHLLTALAGLAATAVVILAVFLARQLLTTDERAAPETSAATTARKPNWILVAEFQAPRDQPNLAVAGRELLISSLQQSEIVTPISRAQIRRGLDLAGKAPDTHVVGEIAHELAFRAGARIYVEGHIEQIVDSYSIVVHAVDTETREYIASVNEAAGKNTDLIKTFDRIGRQLREKLGEKKESLQAARLWQTMSPSFDAYRHFVRAVELQEQREFGESNRQLRAALKLDPDFASAWSLMGLNHRNLGFRDSSEVAFQEALARPERLTERQRLKQEATVALVVRYDFSEALRLYDLLLEEDAFDATSHINRATLLFNLGAYEEALAAQVRAAEVSPYGASDLHKSNRLRTLMQLGRLAEARQIAQDLAPAQQRSVALNLASAAADWAQAESLATSFIGAAATGELLFLSEMTLASIAATRGDVRSTLDLFGRIAPNAPAPFWSDVACIAQTQLWVMMRNLVEMPANAACGGNSTADWVVQGIHAAASDDTATAQRAWQAIQHKPIGEQRRYAIDIRLLEGWLAASLQQWQRVIDLLENQTTRGPGPWFTGRIPIRWLVAEAYEQLERPAAAAENFELVLSPQRMHHDTWSWWGMASSFAHQRLVLLYADLGQAEKAKAHLDLLESSWTQADSVTLGMLEAARDAYARLLASP